MWSPTSCGGPPFKTCDHVHNDLHSSIKCDLFCCMNAHMLSSNTELIAKNYRTCAHVAISVHPSAFRIFEDTDISSAHPSKLMSPLRWPRGTSVSAASPRSGVKQWSFMLLHRCEVGKLDVKVPAQRKLDEGGVAALKIRSFAKANTVLSNQVRAYPTMCPFLPYSPTYKMSIPIFFFDYLQL